MEKNILINDIVNFCYSYNIFSKSITINQIRFGLEKHLDESDFVESLIGTIMRKAKKRKNIDIDRTIDILLMLDRQRYEQEFKGIGGTHE